MIAQALEFTFFLILTFLVISNAGGFGQAVRAIGSSYSGVVRTLQGR